MLTREQHDAIFGPSIRVFRLRSFGRRSPWVWRISDAVPPWRKRRLEAEKPNLERQACAWPCERLRSVLSRTSWGEQPSTLPFPVISDAVPPGLANFGRRSPWRKRRLEAEKPNLERQACARLCERLRSVLSRTSLGWGSRLHFHFPSNFGRRSPLGDLGVSDAVPLGLANFGRRSPWHKRRLQAEKPNFGRRSPPIENDRLVLGSVSASVRIIQDLIGVGSRLHFHFPSNFGRRSASSITVGVASLKFILTKLKNDLAAL
jgi:hypothetical protein